MTVDHIPSASGLPVIGSMLELRRGALQAYERARAEHGDVVRFIAGPPGLRATFYAVFSPQGAQEVLATKAADFGKDNQFYQEAREALGNGLLTSQHEDYQRQRRLIQPLFTPRRVDLYAQAIREEAGRMTTGWADAQDGVVDVLGETSRFALRTVSRVLFGADAGEMIPAVRRCFPILSTHTQRRGFAPRNVPRNWPTPANLKADAAQAELYEVCDQIIAARDRQQQPTETGTDLLAQLTGAEGADGERLDPVEIREHVLIFLLAGHETTATALAFALHLLARHPAEQAEARAEVDRVLGGAEPQAADVDRLPYLTMVLKEAMRLYPPAPAVGRRNKIAVEVDGRRIPAGSDVILVQWALHRHPDHWEDPERFDPTRFTEEKESARHRYAWLPFGGGPRACIGRRFAMLESVLALATVLRGHRIEAVDVDVPVEQGTTISVRGPMRCRVVPR
ncbi:cytochrome P450 [Actinoalloteichus hoggarensis]|uniref:Pentalenene oxygenase n=1 Tax=Actinoalloteichus hoggarensis TaxID=1470176 RepID=A0A221WB10_9PSEU|nr:cytochrome P450 [Actinoalloteichus hoggarensis]ASO22891.1 Pentalenene oxygenase [Actinoalloteichus hoggarensis]MBB5923967.1 cytochrome P450 [Actinoalloteichus hoggarensis]